jgi:hypothetical protein
MAGTFNLITLTPNQRESKVYRLNTHLVVTRLLVYVLKNIKEKFQKDSLENESDISCLSDRGANHSVS